MSSANNVLTPTTHVIFDYGGILLDYQSILSILEDMAHSLGKQWTDDVGKWPAFDQLSITLFTIANTPEHMRELPSREASHQYFADFLMAIGEPHDSDSVERLMAKIMGRKGLRLMPGVNRLIQHLRRKGIPMAVATNSHRQELDIFFDPLIDFDRSCLSHVVCGEGNPEVTLNKPAPDVYLVCAKKFAISPKSLDSCVIFEDSLIGITGAVSTGMKTVLVNGRRGPKFADIEPKVTQIVNNFDEFRPESVGLPPYEG